MRLEDMKKPDLIEVIKELKKQLSEKTNTIVEISKNDGTLNEEDEYPEVAVGVHLGKNGRIIVSNIKFNVETKKGYVDEIGKEYTAPLAAQRAVIKVQEAVKLLIRRNLNERKSN